MGDLNIISLLITWSGSFMNRTLLLLIAIFLVEILLLLLAGWIYNLLANSGVFGNDLRVRRLSAVLFIFLPVLCGLVLFPGVIYMNGQSAGGAPISLPGVSSGLSGKIVYTCQVFGDMERDQVCLILPDGSGQIRLTRDDQGDFNYPSLAPDGQSVIFSGRTQEGGYELFELVLEGDQRQITEGMADATARQSHPTGVRSFSPGGPRTASRFGSWIGTLGAPQYTSPPDVTAGTRSGSDGVRSCSPRTGKEASICSGDPEAGTRSR
jgi:hypothetical protein